MIALVMVLQRRGSRDHSRCDSVSSAFEFFGDRQSVPLEPKGAPGPPRIVEIQENYSAIEGTQTFPPPLSTIEATSHRRLDLFVFTLK